MKLWLSHPTGNTFVRALLEEVQRKRLDFDFFTTVGFSHEQRWMALLPERFRTELSRRAYNVPVERMHRFALEEVGRLLYHASVRSAPPPESWCSIDNVYRSLDNAVMRRLKGTSIHPDALYAYEDGALEQFRAAHQLGVRRIYDLPIAHWKTVQQLLDDEAERLPHWEPTLLSTRDSSEKIDRKAEELALADCIICPSKFVYDSIPEELRHSTQCVVSPFGSPAVPANSRHVTNSRLRVLFAGALTQRKGLSDVFAAMRLLNRSDVELRVLGRPLMPHEFYRKEFDGFIYEPPRAHSAVLEVMLESDLLVLPSIVEGRALVQQEALACGLPLIVTRNAGGEDLIDPGRTGWIVPMRSPATIAEKIDWFASDRERLEACRPFCRQKAAEYSWPGYASRIISAVGALLEPDKASTALSSEIHSMREPSDWESTPPAQEGPVGKTVRQFV